MMPLAIDLFPDIDGLDGLISESETVLQASLGALAILIAFVVIGECAARFKRRSEVEKIIHKRLDSTTLASRRNNSASGQVPKASAMNLADNANAHNEESKLNYPNTTSKRRPF